MGYPCLLVVTPLCIPVVPPVVLEPAIATMAVTGITSTQATLNGLLVNDGGQARTVFFEWGVVGGQPASGAALGRAQQKIVAYQPTDYLYGSITVQESGKVSGDSFSCRLTGLRPGTAYQCRAVGIGSFFYGVNIGFTTLDVRGPMVLLPQELAFRLEG